MAFVPKVAKNLFARPEKLFGGKVMDHVLHRESLNVSCEFLIIDGSRFTLFNPYSWIYNAIKYIGKNINSYKKCSRNYYAAHYYGKVKFG